MAEITLTMTDERLEALEAVMEAEGGVRNFLQEALVELYFDRVPLEKQRAIHAKLKAKRLQANQTRKQERPLQIRTLARPLQDEVIVFEDGILSLEESALNFKLYPGAGLCEALGLQGDVLQPDGLMNAYANFDPTTRKIEPNLRAEITIDNHCSTDEVCYPLSAEEQAMIRGKMDEYCRRQLGKSLEECAGEYSHKPERPAKEQRKSGEKHRKKNPER